MSFIQAQVKNTRELAMVDKAAGTVTVNRELLEAIVTTGLVQPADATTVRSEVAGVCNQAISAADALTQVPVILADSSDTWIADTANNTNVAHNYQRMILSNSTTVNNNGTDNASGIVVQVEPYGLTGDRKIICRFV